MKITAKHVIITDIDRRTRTEAGAFLDAVRRVRDEYEELCKCHPVGAGTDFHLNLVIEFTPEDESA